MPQEITLYTRLLRLAARRWHAEQGLPTLGLHGWLDNAATFDRLAPLLPRLDLVSLDLPGHGKSEHRPPHTRYRYLDYVDDVIAAADRLEWPQFTLLGHSMGGGIACLAAAAFPDRVNRLILIEGLGAVTGERMDMPARLRRSVEALKPQADHAAPAPRPFDVLVRARTAAGRIRRDSAEILVRRSARPVGDGYLWRSDPQLRRPFSLFFTNEIMLSFLSAITAPVLLVTATDGTLRKRHYYPSRVKAIRSLREITLPGHHHLHLDDPLPVARAINGYLETEKDHHHDN